MFRQIAIAWKNIDFILAIPSSGNWYISFCIRTVYQCILQCLQELTNSRYQIVSPEFYFLYIKDYCILRKMLLTILNQKS